jgi:SAM-dependent methyltransferase
MDVRYFPEIFDAKVLDAAKQIILTNEGSGADTEARWLIETPYVTELIGDALKLRAGGVVLDYGCGIGRLARTMIASFDCFVVGVDISAEMRRLSHDYVASERFLSVSPVQLDALIGAGLRFDAAIAVWVLQHCFAPAEDIARINRSLAVQARLFVLNMSKRAVPAITERGPSEFVWASDNVDVAKALRRAFRVVSVGKPDPSHVSNAADGAYWMSLEPGG